MNKSDQLRYLEEMYGLIEDGKAALTSYERRYTVDNGVEASFTVTFTRSGLTSVSSYPLGNLGPTHAQLGTARTGK